MNLDIFWEATTCMPYAIKKVEKLKLYTWACIVQLVKLRERRGGRERWIKSWQDGFGILSECGIWSIYLHIHVELW